MGAESLDDRSLDVVVVGLDGSSASITALRWAASQVHEHGQVHAVHVVVPSEEVLADAAMTDSVRLRHRREDVLREVWVPAAAGDEASGVTPVIREGHVADELLRHADEIGAHAVVVGHHEQARLGPQLVGHVTAKLLHAADRPVVIVPLGWLPEHTRGRPVVVGVGVARGTQDALRWVMNRPGIVRDGLVLAHALGPRSLFRPDGWLDVLAYHLDPTVLSRWVEQDLVDLADRIRQETGAAVEVEVSVEPGRTGPRLVEAGEAAGMLVIGRGEPAFIRSRTIAPYLRHAIVHAPCPIVVVPASDD